MGYRNWRNEPDKNLCIDDYTSLADIIAKASSKWPDKKFAEIGVHAVQSDRMNCVILSVE